ncbi:MAG TPA: polysaccharide biosynthesis tyrosine autokinase [Oculatellaceae cyanobacterium]|jgi:capsular exopolysaccharide synthesis family protein
MEKQDYSQLASLNGNGKQGSQLPLIYKNQLNDTDQEDLNLRRLLTVMRRRALIIASVASVVTAAVVFQTLRQTPIYEGRFQVLVEPVTAQSKLAKLTELAGADADPGATLDYETQIEVLRSTKLMSPIVAQINTTYPDVSYDSLIRGNQLGISRLQETKILEISYRDPDPKKVKFVLEQVAGGYLRYSLDEQQSSVIQGTRFVEGQLPVLRQRVDKLQTQLQVFRQQNNLLDPQTQAQDMSSRMSSVDQQRLDTQVKLNETRTLYTNLQNQLGLAPSQAIASTALSEAPGYQNLLNQLQQVETKIAIELSRFTEESPTVQALRDQQRNLLPLLGQEARKVLGRNVSSPSVEQTSPNSIRLGLTQQLVEATNQIRVLEVRYAAISQAQALLAQQVQQLPVIARQYTDLDRELRVATESLNRFLGVRETLQIEASQKALPWQLILPPKQPNFPIPLNTERNIVLGAIAGMLLGIGAALFAERLDNVFHTPDEIKDATRLPLIGVIPFNKQLKQIQPAAEIALKTSDRTSRNNSSQAKWYNSSPFLESFRSLQTNLRFLGSDQPIHSIVISSTSPSDGKSTVSTNLAQAAAAMGQRVLLVDADMRRPQVHNVLGLENHEGLSDVISTEVNPKEVIQQLPMWEHLYVLTAGQMPPDPTRLLSSKKMLSLMEEFKSQFDLIIYDTPPILGLADGRILSVHTDGIVVVVGLGRTDRSMLMEALDGLKISNAPILGVVANGLKSYTTSSYYYYQGYYNAKPEVEKAAEKIYKQYKK